MNRNHIIRNAIIGIFVSLYALVSIVSTIHVIDFFELSNPRWLAITLAIGFELGAAASLASLVILDKMNKTLVWLLFITITLVQMQGNMYYAFINLEDYMGWVELFGLQEEEPILQKRILSLVSGAILPLVALGFIKSLVDYITPAPEKRVELTKEDEEWLDAPLDKPLDEIEDSEEWEEINDDENIADLAQELADIDKSWDEDHALDQVLNDTVQSEEETYSSGYKEVKVEPQVSQRQSSVRPIRAGLGNPVDDRPRDPGSSHYGKGAS